MFSCGSFSGIGEGLTGSSPSSGSIGGPLCPDGAASGSGSSSSKSSGTGSFFGFFVFEVLGATTVGCVVAFGVTDGCVSPPKWLLG